MVNCLFSCWAFAQEDIYIAPQEQIEWAKQFSGVSGPGMPVEGDGRGGWRSGTEGVVYYGNHPRPEYQEGNLRMCTGSAVEKGLVPPIKPAWELHLRDGVVTLGGDGNYYLTGSSGDNIWAWAEGIELWKSADLHNWEYLGLVWDIDKEADDWVKAWRKHPKRAVRAVWAPEIHYIKGNYFICFSMCPDGIGILKSSTGKPEGPYVNAFTIDRPIVEGIDATLFEDEDGKVYFTYGKATEIALLKDDMSGLAEPFRKVVLTEPDHNPDHHAKKCVGRGMNDLGMRARYCSSGMGNTIWERLTIMKEDILLVWQFLIMFTDPIKNAMNRYLAVVAPDSLKIKKVIGGAAISAMTANLISGRKSDLSVLTLLLMVWFIRRKNNLL